MRYALLVALSVAGVAAWPGGPRAQTDESTRNVIEVSLGGSTLVRGGGGRVTLTDPSVADITAAPGGLLVIGRKVGETNLVMSGSTSVMTYLVKVTLPARAVMSELQRAFPQEEIDARAVGGALVLHGIVSNALVVTQAEELALGYLRSPSIASLGVEPHVINLLQVRARQQVQLEVRFAEVNRRSLREVGLNAVGWSDNGRVGSAIGRSGVADTNPRPRTSSTVPMSSTPGRPGQAINPETNAVGAIFVGMRDGKFPFAATLSLLAQRNLSRTLAEPTLVAMSGQSATFLAGGEVPIPRSTGFGNVTVEFKKFGIQLAFTPTVLGDDSMQLNTRVSVSAPDPTASVIIDGVVTPGFRTRQSTTTIRLGDGQSFAIAGLLADEMENLIEKVPGLGDIPILGVLFSSKSFARKETELVVVVTARLIDPMDGDDVPPLPGEETINDPTDLELFLLGIGETKGRTRAIRGQGGQAVGRLPRQPVGQMGFWR